MADERRIKLDAVVKQRDAVRETVQRVKGRREASAKELAAVEEECRTRGIAPDQLDAAILKLRNKFDTEFQAISDRVRGAKEAVTPYLEGS